MADEQNTQTEETQTVERPEPVGLEGYRDEVSYLRNELSKVRQEAAKHRTERNELRDQMKNMTSIEEVQALQTKLSEIETKAAHDALINKYAGALPEKIREAVNWPTDEAAIKARVEELSEFAVAVPGSNANPSGGLGSRGDEQGDDFDPAALAAQIPR